MPVSAERLDLRKIPFSKALNRFMVTEAVPRENENDPALYLSISRNFLTPTRWNLIRFRPVSEGRALPFRYEASPAALRLITEKGDVLIAMDDPDLVRFESSDGIGLLFSIVFESHEKCLDRGDGTLNLGFNNIGEFLAEATEGTQSFMAPWNYRAMKPEDTEILWSPAGCRTAGYFLFREELALRPALPLRPMEAVVSENRRSFEDWAGKYPELPAEYRETRLYAIYTIWSFRMAPKDLLPHETVFMMRSGYLTRAMTWQQSYQAMALLRDPSAAFSLLYSMFTLQDEYGMLPDGASDKEVVYTATKPPFQGFALSFILARRDMAEIDRKLFEKLYDPFRRWVNWWLSFRDPDGDGLCSYVHGDESGFDDSSAFAGGIPVETPDLAAFLILCLEALGKMAGALGLPEESASYQRQSEEMFRKMLENLWDGEKFVCRISGSHRVVETESISVFQPLILGKRLPRGVIDKLTEAVMDPERYLTPHGIASESLKSPYYDGGMGGFVLGMPIAPVQLMIILGLYEAGKTEEAGKAAKLWLDMGNESEEGPLTVWRPELPVSGERPVFTGERFPGGACSWGAAVFLILGGLLSEIERKVKS